VENMVQTVRGSGYRFSASMWSNGRWR